MSGLGLVTHRSVINGKGEKTPLTAMLPPSVSQEKIAAFLAQHSGDRQVPKSHGRTDIVRDVETSSLQSVKAAARTFANQIETAFDCEVRVERVP
jgi:hypothetical protein